MSEGRPDPIGATKFIGLRKAVKQPVASDSVGRDYPFAEFADSCH